MTRQFHGKLQYLLQSWPTGTVMTGKSLRKLGLSRQLSNAYKNSGWVKAFGPGALFKPQDEIEWYGGLHALQYQLGLNIHVGGKTALEMQGLAHYIPLGKQTIDLLTAPRTSIPKWFKDHQWNEQVRVTENGSLPAKLAIEEISMGEFNIQVSSRERATLELLQMAPRMYSFEEVQHLMASLGTLRADILNKLLSVCTSEKSKRLLLYFGEVQKHAWRSKINEKKCKIGKSLLKITSQKGKYHAKYHLFIPEEYVLHVTEEPKF